MTVAELITAFRFHAHERRREDDRHALWWTDQLGGFPLEELSTGLIRRQLRTLAKRGRSAWTMNFYLRFFRRVCAWGTRMTYLPVDLCTTIPLPKDTPPVLRVLTEEEERKLCAAVGQPYALWIRFAILTGLTQSEQFTLRWRDVDLERTTLIIPHPSTGAVVALSLSGGVVAVLRELRHTHPPSLWVFPDLRNPTRPANIHTFYTGRWESAIRRADIPWCAWKDLRHTCGVRLAQQGVPIEEIATSLRQGELRQAYYYRAWLPGVALTKRPPKPPRTPVFTDLTDMDLQSLMAREATDAPLTFGETCRLYAVHHLKQRPARENFERIYKQLLRQWEDRPLAGLSRKEVRVWFMGLAHTPAHANKALTFLKCVYNVALDMEVYDGKNPAVRIRPYYCSTRERFLSLEEAQRFMEGLPHLSPKTRAYFLTLLLTGARLSEVRCMRWADVEWPTRLWKKSRTKNGKTQFVPLPAQVVEALTQLPRTSEWVFPGEKGRPWCTANPQKLWGLIRRRWNLQDVTIHDLRRTCASYLSIDGENLQTVQSVLNHRGLAHTSIYARLHTKAVDRALQAQADRLCSLVQGPVVLPALAHDASQRGPMLVARASSVR